MIILLDKDEEGDGKEVDIRKNWCMAEVCSDHCGNLSAYVGNFVCNSFVGSGSSKNNIYSNHQSAFTQVKSSQLIIVQRQQHTVP